MQYNVAKSNWKRRLVKKSSSILYLYEVKVGLNPVGDYVLTPNDDASTVLLRRLAEEGDTVVLLGPTVRRHKVVLEC